jgi:DNA-binding GntR family transcriptional regulator
MNADERSRPSTGRAASVLVADAIRDAVAHGRLSPGERLVEEDIAADLGVSRTPVREAFTRLEIEGLIEVEPRKGVRVRALNVDDLDETYRVRALLEGEAARVAAGRIDDAGVAALRESCERFTALLASDDVVALVKENSFFHSTILQASGDRILPRLVSVVSTLPLVYRSYTWYSDEERVVVRHYHTQIANSIEARDAERAESLMREHILHARDLLVRQWRAVRRHDGSPFAPLQSD